MRKIHAVTRSRWHALLVCLAVAVPAAASTFNISPIRVQLSAAHRTGVLTLTNADDQPVVIQVRLLAWSQQNGEEQLDETRELLVTPPVLQIPANSEQVVRVALRRDPDASRELSYRVILEEVPQAAPDTGVGLRVALRLSVPIFVAPMHGDPSADLAWEAHWLSEGKLEVAASNHGTGHLQVSGFDVQMEGVKDPLRAITAKYVLPGSRMTWTLTRDAGTDAMRQGSLVIHGHSDQGEFSAQVANNGS
jgi:fimbrial chaperone protein